MSSLSGRRSQSLVIDMNSNGSQLPSPVLEREFRGSKIEWVPERSLKSQSSREYELRIGMILVYSGKKSNIVIN